jgi:PAS domain S-box-containing protein
VGKPIDDVLREIGLSKEGRNVIAHKECFSKLEFECNSPEKGRLILNVSMTNMEDVEEVILVIEDITEHKQVEEVVRESEERYRSLFEESRDAIYITTREGKFVDLNQSALDLFGYTIEEMKRLYAHELYVNPSDRNEFQQEIEQKGFVRDYRVKLRKKDGTEIDCLITSTVRKATDGSVLGYQGIIRAITQPNQ